MASEVDTQIFTEVKTFLDFPLRRAPLVVKEDFETVSDFYTFEEFFKKNFFHSKTDIIECPNDDLALSDFSKNPKFSKKISDQKLHLFGLSVHQIWLKLAKKILHSNNDDQYSSTFVSNCFVIPGGRFSVQFYWDSFFIIRGLISSGMLNLAKSMILNFFEVLETRDYVPNAFRVFWESRSQPPLLSEMVLLYLNATNDYNFLTIERILLLEKEYQWWMDNRAVSIGGGKLNRYYSDITKPREEMFGVDEKNAEIADEKNPKVDEEGFFREFRSIAESGWDFSSRWFRVNGDISTIEATSIIPIDLNSILYGYERNLGLFFAHHKKVEKVHFYNQAAKKRKKLIFEFLYSQEKKSFFDFNYETKRINDQRFYISNVYPIYFGITEKEIVIQPKIFTFPGGNPVSLVWENKVENEQWDFPNAWAPSTFFLIEVLKILGEKKLALESAQKWVNNAFCAHKETGKMYEKYNVQIIGSPGSNGEYEVQDGFGWSNGLTIYLLDTYGSELSSIDCDFHAEKSTNVLLSVMEWILGIGIVVLIPFCCILCIIFVVIIIKTEIKKNKIVELGNAKGSDVVISDDEEPLLKK